MFLRVIAIIIAAVISSNFLTEAQEIWESFGTTSSPWQISSKLKTITKSSNKVEIENQIHESAEDERNNKWSSESAWISTSTCPLDISFTVENIIPGNYINNYQKTNCWYWKVSIRYTLSTGHNKYYNLIYGSFKHESRYASYPYQETCTSEDGTQSDWISANFMQHRRFRVLFDGDELKIYNDNGENLAKNITGVRNVNYISVAAGPGTHLAITNTSCLKMTTYGQAVPYLARAAEYIQNEQYSSAASEMTKAIDKGLRCYDVYLMRGCTYYFQTYYKSAIEDFSTAINYSANNKETAYYYRGLSKLQLNDDSGIHDLRNGGQEGMVFLRENDLLNYTPGQNKKNQSSRRSNRSAQQKKPALTK